ncbi:glycosyl transferase [Secundilactobacillus pentosiphilus]|uniref:Glycosyl transferase n=1 Tax=Secundilactobacillus pentosiphilus TaxID=1714682 RepID=A0A1Z5ITQ5_9LACO|nr:glycosyltransferase family 2 protein [Secundilactobacillus pentosiphilus]GAX05147.1 glycosyl transferase [Secundilactobacillus pentosiphilus]
MKNNITIAILLSTYNGADYLGEQVDSIISQSFCNWDLYIRDDGSQDSTIKIIQDYCSKDDRIHFINEGHVENLGVKGSFIKLLSFAHADFYMFCDQDDVWLPNKIEDTLSIMAKDQKLPQLVFTDLKVVDQDLKIIESSALENIDVNKWIDFNHLVFDNVVTGCTVMINEKLKQKSLPTDNNKIVMHDWWFALIAAGAGYISYLAEPTILYRQHGNNQVGINFTMFSKLKKLFNFGEFADKVNLQLIQGRYAVKRSKYYPSKTVNDFLKISTETNFLKKIWFILKHRYKKHTWAGTVALKLALLKNQQS